MAKSADQKLTARYSRASNKKKLEEVIGDTVIPFDLDDDGVHVFPIEHPFFRSDETKEKLDALENSDEEGVAMAVLNWKDPEGTQPEDSTYRKFIDAGGRDDDISELLVRLSIETNQSIQAGRPTNR